MDLSDFLAVRSGVSIAEFLRKLSERREKTPNEDDLRETSQLALFNLVTNIAIVLYLVLQERTNSRRKLVLDAIQELHTSVIQGISDDPEFQEILPTKKELEEFKTALPDAFAEWKKNLDIESD